MSRELLKYVVLLSDVYTSAEANSKPSEYVPARPCANATCANTTKVDADLGDAQSLRVWVSTKLRYHEHVERSGRESMICTCVHLTGAYQYL
jgi:hypothetical protein